MRRTKIARWDDLSDRKPAYALVEGVDLVIIRHDDQVSVLYGRCLHRGALLSDGFIDGPNLICGLHGWDYRFETGVSEYNNEEKLQQFSVWLEDGSVLVDADEIAEWVQENPQPYRRDEYLGLYADVHGTKEEPYTRYIHQLAREGLGRAGR
jgi:nitrite reductase/ring-hydroxylating ferredoxin subunit